MLLVVYNVFNDAMILISCIALMCIFFIIVMSQNFDGEAFLECIKDLVRVDRDWVPKEKDCSLYVRPTLIGTEVLHPLYRLLILFYFCVDYCFCQYLSKLRYCTI